MDVSAVEPFTNVACPECGKHTRVKREFGPYTLSRRHAIGGMSLVFVAQDNTLGREVIVKILNEEYSADEKRISAFEEEARITASISHPNVVRVFTTGRAFDRFYIAMEFVTGGHFEHHISERGTIPEAEALPLAVHVVSGLKAAKACGLIHRDVKPGNILLDSNGSAKLVDFGLALVTKGGKATASEIWATPYYVPPETIEGAEEDFRSDIYAFGATMYHALAGKPPCDEESMDTKRLREAKQQILPLQKAARWLHPETCAIIDRCMAYAPDDRFRSYDDLISALKSAEQGVGNGVPAPAKTAVPAATSGRRRGGTTLGQKVALASAVLVVLVAIVFSARMILGTDDPGNGSVKPPVVDGSSDKEPTNGTSGPLPPNRDGATSLAVAKQYVAAGEALKKGNYSEAANLFGVVRDHPNVLEPTGTWAASEAIIASYLDGDSAAAKAGIRKALSHLQEAKGVNGRVRSRLQGGFKDLGKVRPIKGGESKVTGGNEDALVWMLCGLKNWDQGMIKESLPFFQQVAAIRVKRDQAWVEPYVALAGAYLKDAELLRRAEPRSFRLVGKEARAVADELHGVIGQLQTKGRARFNVRCWQLELERLARKSGDTPVRNPDPIVRVASDPEALEGLLKACKFADAEKLLRQWKPADQDSRKRRSAYLQLVQASRSFLAELGEGSEARETNLKMVARDGREFSKVVGGGAHRLILVDDDGAEVSLPWPKIQPDSLIELHRELVKGGGSDLESIRRHERAVAFDFVAGDRDRAREAAGRLSEVSDLFQRRWSEVSLAIKD